MIMIGCDFHPGFEEICLLDTETGLRRQHRLSHALGGEPVRQFYAGLPRPVRVGLEASGYSLWLEEMLEELGCELWVGDADVHGFRSRWGTLSRLGRRRGMCSRRRCL
jgi:transposase